MFLASTEAVLSLRKPQPPKARIKDKAGKEPALHKADKPEPATVVAMKLVGANPDPKITGAKQLPGKVNYFLGKDPKKWRANIPTYGKVRYTNVYPGIDLVFYGQGQKLEYDFIVAPGADPETIALCFGQTPLKIDQNGDLALDTKGGELRLQKPLIYQDIEGIRKPVPGGYVLHPVKNEKQTNRVGFKVAAYDRTRPLVIDPVLVYSTYLGGSDYDLGYGIAVDATGNCYVTGGTRSTDFPTQDPLYSNNAGYLDVFVTSLNPAGDALVYSTYLGGSSDDYGRGIAVDATGNCYVTGDTYSTNFPTQDALYPNNAGYFDAFVSKISALGPLPVPDIKANGSDDPLFVIPSESVDISISLDPGDMAGIWADWWGILLSCYGNFPLFGFQCPIFELPDTSLFSVPWPVGWYIFVFGLDDVPDGAFELDWYDYVMVVSLPAGAQLENIPNFDDVVKEKMRELTGE